MRFYELLHATGTFLQPFLLLAMRAYWGLSFVAAGYNKFLNHEKVVEGFTKLTIPFAELNAYLVAGFELVGGLCLALGLAARLMSIPLIVIMCVAYATAHVDALVNVFHDPKTFIQQGPFNYLLTCLVVFCFGPGTFSIDYLLCKDKKII